MKANYKRREINKLSQTPEYLREVIKPHLVETTQDYKDDFVREWNKWTLDDLCTIQPYSPPKGIKQNKYNIEG